MCACAIFVKQCTTSNHSLESRRSAIQKRKAAPPTGSGCSLEGTRAKTLMGFFLTVLPPTYTSDLLHVVNAVIKLVTLLKPQLILFRTIAE